MRRSLALAVGLAVTVGGAAGVAQTVKPPKVEKKIVVVAGDRDWSATGLSLQRGDRVTFDASGTVTFSAVEPDSAVGPDGCDRSSYVENWPYDAAACDDPVGDTGHAALLADVDGERFVIGSGGPLEGLEGLVYLGINDCTFTGSWRNSGAFTVIIKVERGTAPAPQ